MPENTSAVTLSQWPEATSHLTWHIDKVPYVRYRAIELNIGTMHMNWRWLESHVQLPDALAPNNGRWLSWAAFESIASFGWELLSCTAIDAIKVC